MATRRTWVRALLTAGLVGPGVAAASRLRRYEIAERSMEPSLRPGDYVVAVAGRRALRRGDIIILTTTSLPGTELVKRVIGLGGETVTGVGGRILVDGAASTDRWGHGPVTPDGEWPVPPGHVFVIGDYRVLSTADSRTIGPVPVAAVQWRVLGRYGRRHRQPPHDLTG
ncbi:MAG: signal peptidase I [Acidimicrobiia bacterium]|nr:signal peptidase I [Acidimicrobiia bacterium]